MSRVETLKTMNTINNQIHIPLGVIADAVKEIGALCGTAEAQAGSIELQQFKELIRVAKGYKDSGFTIDVGVSRISWGKGLPSHIMLNGVFSREKLLFLVKELLSGPVNGGAS